MQELLTIKVAAAFATAYVNKNVNTYSMSHILLTMVVLKK